MMNGYLKEDEDLRKLKEMSEKSMERFSKCRGSAVIDKKSGSYLNSTGLDLETVHPMF